MNKLKIFFSYFYKSLKIIFISLGSLFVLIIIIILINFNSWHNIITNSLEAKDNINESLDLLIKSDLDEAENSAKLALSNFEESLYSLNKISQTNPVFKINFLKKEINSLENILESANLLSSSFLQIIKLTNQLNDSILIFDRNTALNIEDKQKLLEILYYFEADLIGNKANINLVLLKLKNTNSFFFDLAFKNNLQELINQLEEIQIVFSRTLPFLRLMPTLGGWPEPSRFLILFQNNDELRPTGGFIGSLATLEVSQLGENINLETSDVYHYDMPSIEHLNTVPPEPIAKYMGLKKWYLRDANWSPDWPSSASFIEELFYQEAFYADKEFNDLDGIFAITPQFVAELINLTGPIKLDNQIYTAENLQSLLQYQTGIAYKQDDIASWDRKDIISDLSTILKERLKNLKTKEIIDLIKIIDQTIIRKDLLIYFTNPNNQIIAEGLNSDGRIIKVNHDYLMIVDANLAAFKTDAVIIKDWFYQIEELNDHIIANLYLNYKHEGGFDWRTTRYRSYTRVLSPMGSQLLSIENASDIKVEDDKDLDKTVIGFFFTVEPKETKQIKISYQLPDTIKNQIENKNYQLYLQRQAGSQINSFNFQFLNHSQLTKDLENDKLIKIFE
jgi:hypothetical protein